MLKSGILIVSIMLPILLMAQSPWTPGKGKQYHQLSFTTVPAYNQVYTNNDVEYELDRFVTDNTLQYYGEIGLGNNLSLTAVVPVKFLKAGKLTDENATAPLPPSGSFSGLGNVDLALKYNFLQKDGLAMAGSMQVSLPADAQQSGTGLRTGFDALSLRPALSGGWSNEKFYTYSFLAYSWYNNDFAANLHFGVEAGYNLGHGFIIAAQISTLQNITDGSRIPTALDIQSGLYLNGYEYTAILIKLIKDIIPDRLGIATSLGGGNGNFVAQSPALTFGVYGKF